MAVRIETGTARTRAVTVTQTVPEMNGRSPNSPRSGCQDVPKTRRDRGWTARMARDLRKSPRTMTRTRSPGRAASADMPRRASASLSESLHRGCRRPSDRGKALGEALFSEREVTRVRDEGLPPGQDPLQERGQERGPKAFP